MTGSKIHTAYLNGFYIGDVDIVDEETPALAPGVVEVPAPPVRADQTWNGERWQFPSQHYADASGVYVGALEEGTQPASCVETRGAPDDAADQRWGGNNWQWQPHYYRNADGTYYGGYAGPDKPAGLIEVPDAPADGRQIWDDQTNGWGPVPAE